jgi:hypothetical protein
MRLVKADYMQNLRGNTIDVFELEAIPPKVSLAAIRPAGRNAHIYKPNVPTAISTRSEKKYNFDRNSLVAFVFGVTAPRRTVAPEGVRLGEGRVGRRNGFLSSRVVARILQRLRVGEGRVGRRNGLVLSGVCVVMTKRCEGEIRGVNVRAR